MHRRSRTALTLAITALAAIGQESRPESRLEPRFLDGKARTEFLARLEKGLSSRKFVSAPFTQEKRLSIFKDTVKSSGVLLFAAPDALRWEIREPFRSILVVSGSDVGKFEFIDGARVKLKLGRGADLMLTIMDPIRAWFAGKFESKAYDVAVSENPFPLVRLAPRAAGSDQTLRRVLLRPAADLMSVESVTLEESSGDTTVMRFISHAVAGGFPEGTFSATNPSELPYAVAASRPVVRRDG